MSRKKVTSLADAELAHEAALAAEKKVKAEKKAAKAEAPEPVEKPVMRYLYLYLNNPLKPDAIGKFCSLLEVSQTKRMSNFLDCNTLERFDMPIDEVERQLRLGPTPDRRSVEPLGAVRLILPTLAGKILGKLEDFERWDREKVKPGEPVKHTQLPIAFIMEAVSKLTGRPIAEIKPIVEAKKTRAPSSGGGLPRGVGVIDELISLLQAGGGTVDQLYEKLAAKFPDRGPGMKATIKTQLNRLPKQGRCQIVKTEVKGVAHFAAKA